MHKRVKGLILMGIISANTVCPNVSVYATENLDVKEEAKIEDGMLNVFAEHISEATGEEKK